MQLGKYKSEKYNSGYTNRKNTIRKIRNGQIQSESAYRKVHARQVQFGKYESGKYKSANTNRKV